ncbi:MAG: hypothetical protein A2406_04475 [Candidatus Komeilibacteria bacterium RIFOXYC1_FULL_37_11]|uniref:Uncharacterized protein n=1 Tax=Candidatus Komeilibacteria bacterium RIFOXYC1_FULL_37_11 TaxID=1798555 RepID=A0A1G2BWQ1_9BACT|nr:MAG: hypothetical protein A2406_04475 [Candidatus Komeilibacteria bacterium RIFOXYC1_FULL_37_11]OGY95746.1 MAG: hypothetical protein A2611_03120 [Candidatus Komeilibacteria bacterium RIFOXYD1_FULL_37_29]OGY97151.1 MAG: hypothetical protein A2543_02205 [Candidatus Komeilibacteria bacterium RIFOXYD2_FULL_37_8]
MKNKRSIIWGSLLLLFLIFPVLVNAIDVTYTPNVPIPIRIGSYDFGGTNIVGPDFLASYIVAIYTYGAGFAGIVAMFMLVIAGWRWLFAAGNASKIAAAKDTVNGVLVGLALLFGGQLLLRQISENFSSIQSLKVQLPEAALNAISANKANEDFCASSGEGSTTTTPKRVEDCEEYKDPTQCLTDTCNLIAIGDFDDRCVPLFNRSNNSFTGCSDCPNTCSCDIYINEFYRNADPCDCDEDSKWVDDKCEVVENN